MTITQYLILVPLQIKSTHCKSHNLMQLTQLTYIHSGVVQAPAEKTKEAVMTAVKAGYRMLDCANDYDNEHVIGEALKELFAAGVVKREELFVQV